MTNQQREQRINRVGFVVLLTLGLAVVVVATISFTDSDMSAWPATVLLLLWLAAFGVLRSINWRSPFQ